MSDPPKNSSPFSFGVPSGSGTQGQTGSLFGTSSQSNTTSSTTPTTQPPLFGGSAAVGSNQTPSSTSLFGNTSSSGGAFQLAGSTQGSSSNLFGGGSTPSRPTVTSNNGQETPKPTFSLQNAMSTTPAGPPPAGLTGGLFGGAASSNAFGTPASKPAEDKSQSAGSAPSLFGSKPQGQSESSSSSLFAAASSKPVSQPPQQTSLFGASGNKGSGTTQPGSSGSLFGSVASVAQNSTTSSAPSSASTLFSTAANNAAPASSNLFGQASGGKVANGNSGSNTPQNQKDQAAPNSSMFAPASSAQQSSSIFGTPSAPAKATEESSQATNKPTLPTTSAGTQSSSTLFGSKALSTPTGPNLFATQGQATEGESQAAAAKPSQPSSFPTSTTSGGPTSSTSLFGNAAKQTTNNSTGQTENKTEAPSESKGAASGTTSTTNMSSSTAGPAPNPQSRLKNKSMDDIITRWGSDLAKYQKEFQQQAEKIAVWDRMLVENSGAIAKLYSKTFQAERDTAEVQKQLSVVEDHQEELSQWLDRYEHDVDELMARQVGQDGALQGPDQERERAYKTADRVSERLTEMGKDLSSMIDEINSASATISKTSRADDPLTSIVRILNGHLAQLQTIDQGTSALQAKISAAQKESSRLGSASDGLGNETADSFYQSMRRG